MAPILITLTVAAAVLGIQGILLVVLRAEAKREREALRELLLATRPKVTEYGPTAFAAVEELPDQTAQERLVFYQSVLGWSGWKRLAHIFQVETRSYLTQARQAHLEGRDGASTFLTGAAWASSQMAVMPQARAWVALNALKAEEAEAQVEAARRSRGVVGSRPSQHVR